MSGSRKRRSTLELGHDAFLDIVANLVGILIILIVVLGTQSTTVIEQIKERMKDESVVPEQQFASDQQLAELAQQSMRAAAAQADSDRLERTVAQYDVKLDVLRHQRGALMDLLAQANAAWEAKKQELDQDRTQAAHRRSLMAELQREHQRLDGEKEQLENRPEEVTIVEHLPTPMAKTVFGDELHFRLKDNRLAVVPVDRLINEIRKDFARLAPSSRNGQLEAAVGPVRGFVARYQMDKNRQLVASGGQMRMATQIQLVGMTLEPLTEPYGEPLAQVLANGRHLDIELAGRDPSSTTITVWVYPDSFAGFRKLKEDLYLRGFATAARPLPADRPISGGPQGTRSRAQ